MLFVFAAHKAGTTCLFWLCWITATLLYKILLMLSYINKLTWSVCFCFAVYSLFLHCTRSTRWTPSLSLSLLQNTAVLSSAIIVTLVGMMLHIHFVKVDHESLIVIRSLGIQMSSSYASGRETTTFIEMSKIKDIVINEAIYMVKKDCKFSFSHYYFILSTKVMSVYSFVTICLILEFQHQIIYYLCVLLKDPSEPEAVSSVVPLFQVRLRAVSCPSPVWRLLIHTVSFAGTRW